MAGFGSLGGLGGRPGGFGMSYPTRVGMPNSQAVDYLRPQEEWQSDFDSRVASVPKFITESEWTDLGPYSPTTAPGQSEVGLYDGFLSRLRASDAMTAQDPSALRWDNGNPSVRTTRQVENPNYASAMSALNAEKEQMMGRYDAQGRNQQAYDIMNGGNQINGIIGPEYTNPNFGRITGAQPQAPNPEDMQWADGLYNATGTYSTAPGRTQGWSLW